MPLLSIGDPAPHFCGRTPSKPDFHFDSMAGRYLVVSFFVSSAMDFGSRFLQRVDAMAKRFDDDVCSFFGVTIDPQDEATGRLRNRPRGIRFFFDTDMRISTLYGVVTENTGGSGQAKAYAPATYVLDPGLRVIAARPMRDPEEHAQWLADVLESLPPLPAPFPAPRHAPVLVVPHVFDPELCQELVTAYETDGGGESGYMVERDGRTVPVLNPAMKRRRDTGIEDPQLRAAIVDQISRRLVPEIQRVHQIRMSRIERYIVACYNGENGGHFRAHRDNTTKGTAHRQFAVSVGLDDRYEGGEVWFPEYGPALYRPPVGGAVVFSCSLLHEVRPVRSGRRMVFLTFLYDDRKAEVRKSNRQFIGEATPAPAGEPEQEPAQKPALAPAAA
ncbi:2OG-Fe(II) oxygenase [Azospirillum halopraeferens]|uniref:2OG-Fe(II) oxygenase n=1 Tax=Azospirillum halopraeferens TaxID=34010 RepID=UPI0004233A8E|nr:2OG-Fe(II) oxygenase [Azospirillum halopraeferens]